MQHKISKKLSTDSIKKIYSTKLFKTYHTTSTQLYSFKKEEKLNKVLVSIVSDANKAASSPNISTIEIHNHDKFKKAEKKTIEVLNQISNGDYKEAEKYIKKYNNLGRKPTEEEEEYLKKAHMNKCQHKNTINHTANQLIANNPYYEGLYVEFSLNCIKASSSKLEYQQHRASSVNYRLIKVNGEYGLPAGVFTNGIPAALLQPFAFNPYPFATEQPTVTIPFVLCPEVLHNLGDKVLDNHIHQLGWTAGVVSTSKSLGHVINGSFLSDKMNKEIYVYAVLDKGSLCLAPCLPKKLPSNKKYEKSNAHYAQECISPYIKGENVLYARQLKEDGTLGEIIKNFGFLSNQKYTYGSDFEAYKQLKSVDEVDVFSFLKNSNSQHYVYSEEERNRIYKIINNMPMGRLKKIEKIVEKLHDYGHDFFDDLSHHDELESKINRNLK